MELDSTVWIWLPVLTAISGAFLRLKTPPVVLLATALLSAYVVDRLEFFAAVSSIGILWIAYKLPSLKQPHRHPLIVFFAWTLILIWCALLFLHRVPGFNNLLVLDNVLAGPHSLPFSMYMNLDKPLAFFALLFAYPTLLGNNKTVQIKPLFLTIAGLFTLFPLATSLGALEIEPSLPSWWWLFALNNLMITCVAEEALFRGFIQQVVSQRFNSWIAIIIASVLFGIAHIGGGTLLVFFASLAGLGYGLIFYFTGRLWCAVVVHFLFNLFHLLFFTYPALAR